jgi:hypothetical protein
MKRYFYSCCLLTCFISWYSCKKPHPNEFRDPFTADQLHWINTSIANPKYRVSTKELDTTGNQITIIDTIEAQTESKTNQTSSVIGDEYAIYYYHGLYEFLLTVNDTNTFDANIEIDNESDFTIKIMIYSDSYNIASYQPDSAKINGVVYTDVYKLTNLPAYSSNNLAKLYYKKGMGFIYFEKFNGSTAEIIQ